MKYFYSKSDEKSVLSKEKSKGFYQEKSSPWEKKFLIESSGIFFLYHTAVSDYCEVCMEI